MTITMTLGEAQLLPEAAPVAPTTTSRQHLNQWNPAALATALDTELVESAKRGDMSAFEELVARHRDRVYCRALSMMRNEEDATDLAQEAWVKGWQRLEQFHGDSAFGTWMTRIVINLCLDQLRQRKRHHLESIEQMSEESGGVEAHLPVVNVNPSENLERGELRKRIDAALAQLTNEHRTVLLLHEFEGMKYREIAKIVGCSIGTVMSRLFNARRNLASLLANAEMREFC